jgi:hypothetical protein
LLQMMMPVHCPGYGRSFRLCIESMFCLLDSMEHTAAFEEVFLKLRRSI